MRKLKNTWEQCFSPAFHDSRSWRLMPAIAAIAVNFRVWSLLGREATGSARRAFSARDLALVQGPL